MKESQQRIFGVQKEFNSVMPSNAVRMDLRGISKLLKGRIGCRHNSAMYKLPKTLLNSEYVLGT